MYTLKTTNHCWKKLRRSKLENYHMFMDWKTYHWNENNILQTDLQIQQNPYQNPSKFFKETDELIIKFIWNCKGPRIAKIILKKNKVGGLTRLNFRTYYKTMVIKTPWQINYIPIKFFEKKIKKKSTKTKQNKQKDSVVPARRARFKQTDSNTH